MNPAGSVGCLSGPQECGIGAVARGWPCPQQLLESDTLSQWQRIAVIDRIGGSSHVVFPAVGTGFPSSTGVFFAAECTADFGPTGTDIHVGDAAVAAGSRQEQFGFAQVIGEQARRQSLADAVIQLDGLFQLTVPENIQDWCKGFLIHDVGMLRHLHDGWAHVAASDGHVRSRDIATAHHTSGVLSFSQCCLHPAQSRFRNQRSHQDTGLQGIADGQGLSGSQQSRQQLIIHRFVNQQSSQRCAALATGAEG